MGSAGSWLETEPAIIQLRYSTSGGREQGPGGVIDGEGERGSLLSLGFFFIKEEENLSRNPSDSIGQDWVTLISQSLA